MSLLTYLLADFCV